MARRIHLSSPHMPKRGSLVQMNPQSTMESILRSQKTSQRWWAHVQHRRTHLRRMERTLMKQQQYVQVTSPTYQVALNEKKSTWAHLLSFPSFGVHQLTFFTNFCYWLSKPGDIITSFLVWIKFDYLILVIIKVMSTMYFLTTRKNCTVTSLFTGHQQVWWKHWVVSSWTCRRHRHHCGNSGSGLRRHGHLSNGRKKSIWLCISMWLWKSVSEPTYEKNVQIGVSDGLKLNLLPPLNMTVAAVGLAWDTWAKAIKKIISTGQWESLDEPTFEMNAVWVLHAMNE